MKNQVGAIFCFLWSKLRVAKAILSKKFLMNNCDFYAIKIYGQVVIKKVVRNGLKVK